MKREILGVLLAFSASGVDAKTLYKCVVKGKPASYQSDPCPGTTAKVWGATPEPQPSNAELWRRYNAEQKQRADSAYLPRLARTDGRGRAAPMGAAIPVRVDVNGACQSARAHRDRILYEQNLNVSIQTRRILHDAVYDACK